MPSRPHYFKLRNRVFYLLSQTALDMGDDGTYNDLVMVAGNAQRVLEHSFGMLDRRQFYQRLGMQPEPDKESPPLSIYDSVMEDYMLTALLDAPGREEVDGAWIVHNNGLVEPGTYYLCGDVARLKKRVRRLEAGAGRIAVRAISLMRGTAGYMLKKTREVREYGQGRLQREFTRSGLIKLYDENGALKQEIDVNTGMSKMLDPEGGVISEYAVRILPVKKREKQNPHSHDTQQREAVTTEGSLKQS